MRAGSMLENKQDGRRTAGSPDKQSEGEPVHRDQPETAFVTEEVQLAIEWAHLGGD